MTAKWSEQGSRGYRNYKLEGSGTMGISSANNEDYSYLNTRAKRDHASIYGSLERRNKYEDEKEKGWIRSRSNTFSSSWRSRSSDSYNQRYSRKLAQDDLCGKNANKDTFMKYTDSKMKPLQRNTYILPPTGRLSNFLDSSLQDCNRSFHLDASTRHRSRSSIDINESFSPLRSTSETAKRFNFELPEDNLKRSGTTSNWSTRLSGVGSFGSHSRHSLPDGLDDLNGYSGDYGMPRKTNPRVSMTNLKHHYFQHNLVIQNYILIFIVKSVI